MDYLDTRWTKLKDYDFGDNDDSESETKKFINSDDESGDEEWVQQLQRDYGKSSGIRLRKNWSKWTQLERYLAVSLVIASLIGLLLCTLLIGQFFSRSHRNKFVNTIIEGYWNNDVVGKMCLKSTCIERSFHINQYIDPETSPCEDFYRYSCGKWLDNVEIPSGNSKWTSFTELAEKNQRRLKTILEKLHPLKNDSEAVHKLHMYYKACQDEAWMEKNGLSSLKSLIKEMGNWGLNATEWNDEDWSFEQTLMKVHKLKSMPFFYVFVAADDFKSSENTIQIQQSGITLPDEKYYTRNDQDKVVKAYKKLMVDVGLLLGGNEEKTKQQMEEVFQFEKKMAAIYETNVELVEKRQSKMTVEQLQDLCPAIPWLDYMNSMFNTKVTFDEPVVVYTPHYLKNMSDLVIRTERRILANYMIWHFIKPLVPILSKPFRDAYSKFLIAERGLQIVNRSWRTCVTQTDSVFGFATGYLAIKESGLDLGSINTEVERMIGAVKESLLADIVGKQWIDDETKLKAIEKVSAMNSLVGFPDWIFDANALARFYNNLTVTANPFKNYLNARQFYHQKTMNRRNSKPDRNEWHVTPTSVNAFYNSPQNYIAFPFGILQSPFYSPDLPLAVNFGALGTIIAHELTHGFDNHGRLFDHEGNMKNWWSQNSKTEFDKLSECFEEQYSNLTSTNMKLGSKQTLSENIADNGGLKLAYSAYKSLSRDSKKHQILAGVPLNPDQLFFVSFAQVWCSAMTAESAAQASFIDRHSPDHIRVIAAISNSKMFADVFGCKKDSRMNPNKKCEIW